MSLQVINEISEDEMIASFLIAEAESPRFKGMILKFAKDLGIKRSVIFKPNLASEAENKARKKILNAHRGYIGSALFEGFPKDVKWKKVKISAKALLRTKYIGGKEWVKLSKGSLLAIDGAESILDGEGIEGNNTKRFFEVTKKVNKGVALPTLIFVTANNKTLVVLEGHTRLTAYFMAYLTSGTDLISEGFEAIVGFSENLTDWRYYPRPKMIYKTLPEYLATTG
jgi:hypothetical protein